MYGSISVYLHYAHIRITLRQGLRRLRLARVPVACVVVPLTSHRLLLKLLPPMINISARERTTITFDNLHLRLGHCVDKMQLRLGNLDDLLD